MDHTSVDVAVIGGGPAGAAAVLTLLKYTNRAVAVIDRGDGRAWRVGETIPPGVAPLLAYLDVGAVLDSQIHRAAHGTAAAWGGPALVSRDFLFTGRGHGWHLDRRTFDRALIEAAFSRCAVALTGATVATDTREHRWWRLGLRLRDGDRRVLRAAFVIDATGQPAAFATRRGARRRVDDPLLGVAARYAGAARSSPDLGTVVESVPDGWWYSARLPRNHTIAVFMTDADGLRRQGLRHPDGWGQAVAATRHTSRLLMGATMDDAPMIVPAFSQELEPVAGDGWIATGDAAVSFDPLASRGIGYAILSGIHAARAADDWLSGGRSRLEMYRRSVRRHYREYWSRRTQFYLAERRWPDAPFWARRHPEGDQPALARSGASSSA